MSHSNQRHLVQWKNQTSAMPWDYMYSVQEERGTNLAQSTQEAPRILIVNDQSTVSEEEGRDLAGRNVGGWYSGKNPVNGQARDLECVWGPEQRVLEGKEEESRWKRQVGTLQNAEIFGDEIFLFPGADHVHRLLLPCYVPVICNLDFEQQTGRVLTNLSCQVWAAGKVIIALATWEKWFKIMMTSVVLDILNVSHCELCRELCTWRLGERIHTAIAVGIHRLIILARESNCCFNTYCVLDIVQLVPFYFQVFLFFMQSRYISSFSPFLLFS